MLYPLAIQAGDRNTAFGVIVPDLPGCFSAGDLKGSEVQRNENVR